MRHCLFISLLLAISGCSVSTAPPQCAGILIPALRVIVRDGRDGAFIGSGSTIIAARRGAETDTVVNSAGAIDSSAIFIGFAPGIYELVIHKQGYVEWTESSIGVATAIDGCHPSTSTVEASLSRLP
jgi:hypothetical protein